MTALAEQTGSAPNIVSAPPETAGVAWLFDGLPKSSLAASSQSRVFLGTIPKNPAEEIFDRLVDLKVHTSQIAMHLKPDWQLGLFGQLDSLLDTEYWDIDDELPGLQSFRTFLRLLVHLGRPRRPGLAITDTGNVVATWTVGANRLTIECKPNDRLTWVLSRVFDDGSSASAAGNCATTLLKAAIAAYEPEVWFDADRIYTRL